ncbi:hypothetical protein QWY82_18300 [Simiduia curdlanivorans]|uniref:Alginate export domain-containing protein n=1 Tax=Simiduia curdlanivorans TaxID=1492769 RepID=A0ABV8V591_9GAMM|nr:hypothetical protein [Simiduia curdlanivorans]MDN3640756.1 hypothetical protein [Simiduia curdlanivorans]
MNALPLLMVTLVASQPATSLEYTLDKHRFELGFRPRVASVEGAEDARAASVLLRAGARSHWSDTLSTLLEIDTVALGWEDEFSNGENFNGKPVIPDVGGIDLNQALVRYSPTNRLQLSIGREAVNLGNERFVGTNSFWQNEQTLDMAGFKVDFASASNVSYRYVTNANRISGDEAGKYLSPSDSNFEQNNGLRPAQFLGDHGHNTHLLFAEFKEWDYSRLQAYYLAIDIEDAPALSNDTLGLRYEFKGRLNNLRTLAHAEYAFQERPDVDRNNMIRYYNIGAGLGYRSSEISLNIETLGENSGTSFATPLASLHDFNGWSDQFLITPDGGLRDYSIQYIWRKNPWKIDARYHVFHADDNNARYGQEFDLDLSMNMSRNGTLLLRYADFIADDDNYANERRIFLMYIYNL